LFFPFIFLLRNWPASFARAAVEVSGGAAVSESV
jgi:hypothetical protein